MRLWTKRWLRRLRALVSRGAVERELNEELVFHLEMEAEKLRRAGMSADEARRRAGVAFGGVEHAKEGVRDARWLSWVPGFTFDLRLGARMLAKSPGIAIVGGLGMAVAVAVSAGAFAIFNSYFYPQVPLHEGDRIVSLVNFDPLRTVYDKQVIHDFGVWRRALRSVVDLGAFRTIQRNLITPSDVEPIELAEMTASGFRVARVAPLFGRTLVVEDERTGAAPVVVIGERIWRSRFEGNPAVIGTAVRLGDVPHTIVGVMPEEFAFPVNHSWWVPLRADPDMHAAGTGPALHVFGRLAPGVTREEAQAELAVLGQRLAASRAGTPLERLEPRIMPYTEIFVNSADDADGFRLMRFTIVLLLVLVAMNVGVLVYARTVNRSGEIAVRTALGATRRRIVMQLFAEALVLSSLAALVGLGMVAVGLRLLGNYMASGGESGPFWIDPGLSAGTVAHALVLSILGAAIVGLFPALRATRELRMTIGSAGSGSEARLGPTWTALIIVQVAAAVAILPPAMLKSLEFATQSMRSSGLPADEFLAAGFTIEREDPATESVDPEQADAARADHARITVERLLDRLAEEPAVAGTALSSSLPWGGGTNSIEVEGKARGGNALFLEVGPEWFDLLGVHVLAGRDFLPADAETADRSLSQYVIVNRTFVTDVLAGGAAVGRRVRYESGGDEPRPWLEVVGVVEDFPVGFRVPGLPAARIYHPSATGGPFTDTLTIRLRGQTPAEFTPQLRRIAASVDPMLQLSGVGSIDSMFEKEMSSFAMIALAIAVFAASVLLLSAAGIHALISFVVNKRRREIGIRAALGADARRILTSILARSAGQLAIGVAVGLVLAVLLDRASGGALMSGAAVVLIPATAMFMAVVGLVAAVGPARRALAIAPTEAIRAE